MCFDALMDTFTFVWRSAGVDRRGPIGKHSDPLCYTIQSIRADKSDMDIALK